MKLRAGVSAAVLASTLALMAGSAGPLAAQAAAGWPQWQGPNRDGIAKDTGLLARWPEGGPKLLWTANGCGSGFSSVAIVGGRAYTMGDRRADDGSKAQYVIAIDLATRRTAWATKIGQPHSDGSRCTPTVDRGLVYAIGTDGQLVCLSAATGQERWRKSFEGDFGGQMMSGWRWSESPLVDGENVICTPGGAQALMVALNRQTGDVVWKCAAGELGPRGKDGAGYSSAVITTVGGIRQYVQMVGRGLIGVRASDGKLLWNYNRVANDVANITTPIVRGDLVFGSSAYGAGSALVKLVPSAEGIDAQEVYFVSPDLLQNHHGGLLLVGDYIYGGQGQNNGKPTCLDLKTGKIVWQQPNIGGGSASVVYADGNVIYHCENGVVGLVAATPAGYQLRGRFETPKMPGTGWAHPVVTGGRLYIRHDDALFCYDLRKP